MSLLRNKHTKTFILTLLIIIFTSVSVLAIPLSIGNKNSTVSKLQRDLKTLGYFTYPKITGYFGKITKASVKAFQKDNNLKTDGKADTITLNAIAAALNGNSSTSVDTPNTTASENLLELKLKRILKYKVKGSDVKTLQQMLKDLGYLNGKADGIFGRKTKSAVKAFQRANGLKVDGIVGTYTAKKLNLIYANKFTAVKTEIPAASKTPDEPETPDSSKIPVDPKTPAEPANNDDTSEGNSDELPADEAEVKELIQKLHWNTVNKIMARKTYITVTDIDTGITFTSYRMGGTLHADVEPVSKSDVADMKKAYGGKWSWARRAVIVTLADGTRLAGSMNGMPHGRDTFKNNNFNGQFCIHFLGSKIHKSGRIDSAHQSMVKKAANFQD